MWLSSWPPNAKNRVVHMRAPATRPLVRGRGSTNCSHWQGCRSSTVDSRLEHGCRLSLETHPIPNEARNTASFTFPAMWTRPVSRFWKTT